MQVLPLIPSVPSYRFGTTLGDISYVVDVHWNARDGAWYMDILDENANTIRGGIKIVLGSRLGRRCVSPLFPFGVLVATDLSGAGIDAGLDDLGTRVQVAFITAEEWLAL